MNPSGRNAVPLRAACLALVAASCTGSIGSDPSATRGPGRQGTTGASGTGTGTGAGPGSGTGGAGLECSTAQGTLKMRSGALPMRRVTRTEYDNTIRDLLGDDSHPARGFSPDDSVGPLLNNVTSPVTALMAEQYRDAAEAIATRAAAQLPQLLAPCDPNAAGEAACATQFIQSFGRRMFRRALETTEVETLRHLYDTVYADIGIVPDFATRIRVVLEAMLQAPSFLYRFQRGKPVADGSKVAQLDGYEIATRLSYLLWASSPDDALLAAAERNELATAPGIDVQVVRMLADAKFAGAIDSFHTQWLGLDDLGSLVKDAAVYPAFDDSLRTAMRSDVTMFAEDVIVRGDARLETLFLGTSGFVTPALAQLYGVVYPGPGTGAVEIQLSSTERAGLLTKAAFLAMQADPNQSSPIKRGVAVRERILCQGLPPPMADIPEPEPPRPGATTRERFAAHTSVPGCAACHVLIDPIGFGFENYDGIGRFRSSEEGRPVDSTGELTSAGSAEGKFNGAVELAGRLAESDGARTCVADLWLRFALGTPTETCTLDAVKREFAASGYDIRRLLAAVARADAFRYGRIDQ